MIRSLETRRVAIYCRVSTAEQARDGLSLDVQEGRIRDYCNALELTVVEVIRDEGHSGKDLDRPGVERIFELIAEGAIDAVAIHKLDRLTRSVEDFGRLLRELDEAGVSLLSVKDSLDTSNASGRLVVNIMLSVSQWEREVIVERTKEALAEAKAKGTYLGKPPVGWRVEGGQLVPSDRYWIVERVHGLRGDGLTLKQIAARMNDDEIPTATGSGGWHVSTVQRALRAPLVDEQVSVSI